MKVETQFEVTTANAIKPGDFFAFWQSDDKPTFALAIEFDKRPAAFVFERNGSPRNGVRMAMGLPEDSLVHFPNAVVRSSLQDRVDNRNLYGALIATPEGRFMRAYGNGDYTTINVATGQHSPGAIGDHQVAFSKWEVGTYKGETFLPIFAFDCAAN